jgi:hypothetical protein
MIDARFGRGSTFFVFFLCLLLTILADQLFYRQPAGWSLAIFGWAILIALVIRNPSALFEKRALKILLASAGLLPALIAQPGPIAVLLIFLGLITFNMIGRQGWVPSVSWWFKSWIVFGVQAVFQWLQDVLLFRRLRQRAHGNPSFTTLRSTLRNWILPGFFSLLFIGLFSMANPVIESWIKWINVKLASFHLDTARAIFWTFNACLLWGLFRARVHTKREFFARNYLEPKMGVTPAFLIRSLGLFNLIFAAQNTLDAMYLWGGMALPDGLTYADYAHRGAYPLIFTALLAAVFVLATFGTQNSPTVEMRPARIFVYAWLAQNVLLTLSSIARLAFYVQAYSLTRWRIAAAIWMFLIACGLVLTGIRIIKQRTNVWLLNSNFLAMIAVLYLCCYVNFDGLIANYNVDHCREMNGHGLAIDLNYLRQLGPESMPALQRLAHQNYAPGIAKTAALHLEALRAELRNDLSNWRAWTYRKQVLASQFL